MDTNGALWATRNSASADDYAGTAREDARRANRTATKLELAASRDLRAADFALQSLMDFTKTYCSYSHTVMKSTLQSWMQSRSLDAIVRANRDPNEIVIARPVATLRFVSATGL